MRGIFLQIFPVINGNPLRLRPSVRPPDSNTCGNPVMQGVVTWQGFGPLYNPQQLFLTQPVETIQQKMWNFWLGGVVARVHDFRLDVFQNVNYLLGELHIVDAWYTSHGGQGLTITGHGQVGLEHQGWGQTEGFQGSKALQLPACDTKIWLF